MSDYGQLEKLLGLFTFWRVVIALIVVSILRIAQKYLELQMFFTEAKTKYGGKTYFRFPVGFPARFNDPDDSLIWDKQSVVENPK